MHAEAECLRGHSVAGSWDLGVSQPIGLYSVSFSFSHFLQLSESSGLCRFSGLISNLWSMRPELSHSSQIWVFQIIFEILLVSLFISTFLFIFICNLMSLENYWLKTNWVTDSSSAIGKPIIKLYLVGAPFKSTSHSCIRPRRPLAPPFTRVLILIMSSQVAIGHSPFSLTQRHFRWKGRLSLANAAGCIRVSDSLVALSNNRNQAF